MVFKLHQLPVERQRNVGRALALTLDRERPEPLTERTVQAGREVIALTERLQDPPGVGAIVVDVSTDIVLTATHRLLRAWTRAFAGDLIALERPQQELLEAVALHAQRQAQLRTRWHGLSAGGVRGAANKVELRVA